MTGSVVGYEIVFYNTFVVYITNKMYFLFCYYRGIIVLCNTTKNQTIR